MPQPMLFSPLEIRGMHLRNRVVVAPMHQYSAVEGFANDWHLVNAGKFAQGGAGLVIMESTKVARNGAGTVGDVGLWDDQFITPLARCAAFIKAHVEAARPSTVLGLGYSNGANILAATLFSAPTLFDGAVLMHPLIPFEPQIAGSLAGKRVLITAGRRPDLPTGADQPAGGLAASIGRRGRP